MTTELKVERVPWVQLVLLIVIFSFLAPIWVSMLQTIGSNWYSLGAIACALWVPVAPFLFIVGASLLKAVGVKIKDTTMTWLYAAGAGMTQIATYAAHPLEEWFTYIYSSYTFPEQMTYLPWFIAPRADIAKQIVAGGVPIPWIEWLPSLLFWWVIWASGAIIFVALASLFRRQWIDVERVPFPQTTIMHNFIGKATSQGKLAERLGRPFIIGILLSVLFQFPLTMINLFPWFPDIYGWRTNTCLMGTQWLTPSSP